MRFLMKAAGVLLITAGFCLNGISLSKQYRQRVNALERSLAALTTLILRLKATLAPPSELISGFCREFDSLPDYVVAAEKLLCEFEFDSAWEKAVLQSELALNQSDRRLICRFGEILGKSDIETQLSQLNLLTEQLKNEIASAKAESQQKRRLCQTLCTLAGAAVSVLLL